jgi:hypothetical protein
MAAIQQDAVRCGDGYGGPDRISWGGGGDGGRGLFGAGSGLRGQAEDRRVV